MKKMTGLGRGLDALIDTTDISTAGSSSISEVEIARISPNPNQPRRTFDEEALAELAMSIREHGVIVPVTLKKNEDDTYTIIAGERRYRAAKQAGLNTVPAYVRTVTDVEMSEMALIENIQREDLDAIEIALAYQRLMDDYNLTQERMAERVGKKRATVANYLRLLKLPAEIQMGLKEKKLEMGHARAILGCKTAEDQLAIYHRLQKEGLSVRKVEELVASGDILPAAQPKASKPATPQMPEIDALQQELTRFFGSKVSMTCTPKGSGKITISFANDAELERIMQLLDTRR